MDKTNQGRRRIKLPVVRSHSFHRPLQLADGQALARLRPLPPTEGGALVPGLPAPALPFSVVDPDLAVQTSPCIENVPGAPANVVDLVTAAFQQALGQEADVRYRCEQGTGRLGAWLFPPSPLEAPDARDRGLSNLDLIPAGGLGTFAFLVSDNLIRRQAQAAFAALPKRLNLQGEPDPDGRVHLESLTVQFQSPNKVVTRVKGFYDVPNPLGKVDFEQIITDTLSVSGGEVQCTTETDLDVDAGFLGVLLAVFLFLAAAVGPAFLLGFAAVIGAGILIGSLDGPDVEAGAGCVAAALIPQQINVPGGQKLVATYTDLEVDARGIVARGFALLAARTPSVAISGPREVSAIEGETSVSRRYVAANLQDLLEPVSFAWTADGTVLQPTGSATFVVFDTSGSSAGDVLARQVSLTVTDQDGLTARAQATVAIHVIPDLAEELPDDVPPICLRKPWLPECRHLGV